VLLQVPEVIDDVLAIYERKSKYKKLTIERRIEPGLTVCALQGEIKQILSNLIVNAIDASSTGGRIIVHARRSRALRSSQPGITITIADNGSGISDQDKAKLFSPFFTTKKDVGTGLGLWITRDLLEKKGGHIRFRSRMSEPSGTVMSIYMPEMPPSTSTELIA
jgi:signal transduction histidine kinase